MLTASHIGEYHLQQLLGDHALYRVYAARHQETGSRVILQVPASSGRPTDFERLRHGAALAHRLSASAVVLPMIATELVDGCPVVSYEDNGSRPLAVIREQLPFPLRSALRVGIALSKAIGAVHREAIAHRMLSEATVWKSAQSEDVHLFDFTGASAFARSDKGFRHAATISGDLRYLSPEQTALSNRIVDYRCDFYSLGVILFQILSGQVPFDTDDPMQLAHSHIARRPPLLHEFTAVPEPLSRIVDKLLAKNAENRYQSSGGLRVDLERCLDDLDARRPPVMFQLGTREMIETLRLAGGFYGRQNELAQLTDEYQRVVSGQSRLVLVSGPGGVGKTRLVSQLEDPVTLAHGRYISGKFDQYKLNIPYFALVQAFRVLVAQLLGEGEHELKSWRGTISEAVKGNGQVILDVLPDLEAIIGPQPPVQPLPPVEARNRFNRVLRDFVRLFARRGQPLCLVLDDLQWADPASLALLQVLVNDPDTTHLMVIGIYRDSEVTLSDGLRHLIDELRASRITFGHVALSGLHSGDISALIRDTFCCEVERTAGLAALLQQRTDGNSLFVTHLIEFLCDEGLIFFDQSSGTWIWDVPQIEAKGVTESVLGLMTGKIAGLSRRSKRLVKVAACLGSDFDSSALAAAAGIGASECAAALAAAVDAGILVAAEGAQSPAPGARFRFLHDRVQQAAYALIRPRVARRWHLTIGRRLWRTFSEHHVMERLFELLGNLNHGAALVKERSERLALASLNRVAGSRARESLAHQDALRYINAGLALLPDDAWQTDYELCFDLHRRRFECEYQLGNVGAAAGLVQVLLSHAASDIDRASIYYTKILLDTGTADYRSAVSAGANALSLFDIDYPAQPRQHHLFYQLALVKSLTFHRRAVDLLALPEMRHAKHKAAARILMSLLPAAYFTNPNLLMLTGLKIVTLSLRYGNSPASAPGYVLYGLGIGTALRQYRVGYEFGRLAVDLATRYGDIAARCKAMVIFGGFVNLWRQPIASSIRILKEAYDVALQAGDFQYANYAILQIIFLNFSSGAPLKHVLSECQHYERFVLQTKDDFAIDNHRHWLNAAGALQGLTSHPFSLEKDGFHEEEALARYRKDNATTLCYYYVLKLVLAYHAGAYQDALRYASAGERVIESAPGQIVVVDFYFYLGLTCAAALRSSGQAPAAAGSAPGEFALLPTLRRCHRKLALWARNCPQNFECHALLLHSEILQLTRRFLLAAEGYEKGHRLALERNQHCLAALAAELSYHAHLRHGLPIAAASFLEKARQGYARWGASVPIARLEREMAVTQSSMSGRQPGMDARIGAVTPLPREQVDLASISRIALAVADESDLKRLLDTMTTVLLEATGASRAAFLVVRAGTPVIEVDSSLPPGEERANGGLDAAVSMRIVNYVLRTKADVVLGDATADGRFNSCPYIRGTRARSVLCAPMLKQTEVTGVVYLENEVTTDAFTPDCLKLVQLIGAEIALAVENARVGNALVETSTALSHALRKVDNLELVKGHLSKFVPRSLQESIDENPRAPDFAKRDIDVSVMFLDVAGYTRLSETFDRASMTWLIERYFSSFLDLVHENGGDVNHSAGDGLMVIFRDKDTARHAVRAVNTALAMQSMALSISCELANRFPPLLINIGINSGTCSVGSTKLSGAQGDYWTFTASGSVTNQAARFAAHAKEGTILVSDETASRVRSVINLESLGNIEFKNVSKPLTVHRVVGYVPSTTQGSQHA